MPLARGPLTSLRRQHTVPTDHHLIRKTYQPERLNIHRHHPALPTTSSAITSSTDTPTVGHAKVCFPLYSTSNFPRVLIGRSSRANDPLTDLSFQCWQQALSPSLRHFPSVALLTILTESLTRPHQDQPHHHYQPHQDQPPQCLSPQCLTATPRNGSLPRSSRSRRMTASTKLVTRSAKTHLSGTSTSTWKLTSASSTSCCKPVFKRQSHLRHSKLRPRSYQT